MPEACKVAACVPFYWLSHEGQTRDLFQKIIPCLPSLGLEHAIDTVSSKLNGSVYHLAEIPQCSIPSARSRVCEMSQSSITTINQVCLLHRKNNCCTEESNPCICWVIWNLTSPLQWCFLEALLESDEISVRESQGSKNRDHQKEGSFFFIYTALLHIQFLLSTVLNLCFMILNKYTNHRVKQNIKREEQLNYRNPMFRKNNELE